MNTKAGLMILMILVMPHFIFAYDLVLKNGKIIKGTVISEDEQKIVLKDASGIQLSFKKSNVDLEKTEIANRPAEKPAPAEKTEKPAPSEEPAKPKKPARVYTERDIPRLRSSNPLKGPESAVKKTESETKDEEKGEDYWRNTSSDMLSNLHAAQEAYNQLNQACQKLQGATVQTHDVVNEKGESLDIAQTTQEFCDRAEDAKGQYEQMKADYENFMEEARMESVPPGWLATDE